MPSCELGLRGHDADRRDEREGEREARMRERAHARCIGTRGARPLPRAGTQPAMSSASAASKTSLCRSTSAAVVAGHISAMLWNGVMTMPRLSV